MAAPEKWTFSKKLFFGIFQKFPAHSKICLWLSRFSLSALHLVRKRLNLAILAPCPCAAAYHQNQNNKRRKEEKVKEGKVKGFKFHLFVIFCI